MAIKRHLGTLPVPETLERIGCMFEDAAIPKAFINPGGAQARSSAAADPEPGPERPVRCDQQV
jgi:hypothetical protein